MVRRRGSTHPAARLSSTWAHPRERIEAPLHTHAGDPHVGRPAHSALAYGIVAAVLAVVGIVLPRLGLWERPSVAVPPTALVEGRIVDILDARTTTTPAGTFYSERLRVALPDATVDVERAFQPGGADGFPLAPGGDVLLSRAETEAGVSYVVRDRVRSFPVWTVTLAFAVLVIAVGGWQGARSLIGLAATVIVIGRFVVPAILGGADALAISILGSLVIMGTTLTLGHGANAKTVIALLGTACALLLTGVLSAWGVGFAALGGLATEDAATLHLLTGGAIDPRGLLLGGIIIGAVGVLDDVTTTQASAVLELHEANPALGAFELFRRGMNVGRDHIAATTNTLLLAYAGASLPLLILIAAQETPLGVVISLEAVTTEIVRTVIGSIGIVAAVPVTTAVAAAVATSGARSR